MSFIIRMFQHLEKYYPLRRRKIELRKTNLEDKCMAICVQRDAMESLAGICHLEIKLTPANEDVVISGTERNKMYFQEGRSQILTASC